MIYYIIYLFFFFFFNDTATTEIYTLSLHDALPIPCPMANPHFVASTGRDLPRPRLAHTFSPHRHAGRPARCYRPRRTAPDNRARRPGAALRQQLSLRCRPRPGLEPDAQRLVFSDRVGHGSRNSRKRVWAWCGPMPDRRI